MTDGGRRLRSALFLCSITALLALPLQADPPGRADTVVLAGLERLGTPYAANTLIGSANRAEQLVCRVDSLDCMTFLEACIAASSGGEFCDSLRDWRYRDGVIDWHSRLHFFSDWGVYHPELENITARLPRAEAHDKVLNQKADGSDWLPGLAIRKRALHRAPASEALLKSLRHGDLVGFWSEQPGLDVSHTGMIVIEEGVVKVLHASARKGQVILEPLVDHAQYKRGLMVLRWK
jgi:hypothetical protein